MHRYITIGIEKEDSGLREALRNTVVEGVGLVKSANLPV